MVSRSNEQQFIRDLLLCISSAKEHNAIPCRERLGARLYSTVRTAGFPPHIAVKLRDPEMCQWLIQAGADVNVRDKAGRSPLHLCWERADGAVWKISPLLVDAEARFDIPDSCGQT